MVIIQIRQSPSEQKYCRMWICEEQNLAPKTQPSAIRDTVFGSITRIEVSISQIAICWMMITDDFCSLNALYLRDPIRIAVSPMKLDRKTNAKYPAQAYLAASFSILSHDSFEVMLEDDMDWEDLTCSEKSKNRPTVTT